MKSKYFRIAIIVVAVLLIVSIGWRMWPCSLSNVISVDKSSIISFTATASISGIQNGEPYLDSYNMSSHRTDAEILKGLLEILDSSAYRPDFRNLLPWQSDSIGADENYDGRVVLIVLGWGNNKEDYVEIQLLSSSLIAVKQERDSEFMIYHPADRNLLGSLVEYIQENGEKS